MPIREEEVEIRKRPVVKEKVRARKQRQVEHRAAEAELRKEQVEVEGESARLTSKEPGAPGRVDPTREK